MCFVIILVCPFVRYEIPFYVNKYNNFLHTSLCGMNLGQLTVAALVMTVPAFVNLAESPMNVFAEFLH